MTVEVLKTTGKIITMVSTSDIEDAKNTRIGLYLALDEWHLNEAVQLIENIDPEESVITGEVHNFRFESITLINGDTIPKLDPDTLVPMHFCEEPECEHCERVYSELSAYQQRCKATLRLIEKRSENLSFASPKQWLDRAALNNLRPAWLDWVISCELLPSTQDEKHLTTKHCIDKNISRSNLEKQLIKMIIPKRKDEWFEVIRECVFDFENEFKYTPTAMQLWLKLNFNPPKQFVIVSGDGEIYLELKSLTLDELKRRYKRYYPVSNQYN